MQVDEEDILADPASVPYSSHTHRILQPHLAALSSLLAWEPGQPTDLSAADIPVLSYLKASKMSRVTAERSGVVPFVGSLDLTARAEVHNWIDTNIPEAQRIRHVWIG